MESFPNADTLIDMALEEDLREDGDVTSESIFTTEEHKFRLISKDSGILCGIDLFKKVMARVDSDIEITVYFNDGDAIAEGDLVAEVAGRVVSVLKAERTALNFLSLLSAVATRTSEFVRESKGKIIILDTRKTIPGFRHLQKYAVRCGGGSNHRMGLWDMVLIKDNHIDATGGIGPAIQKVREKWGNRFKVEVETRNITEVKEALSGKADRIMLDNMNENDMREAVKLIGKAAETEASGNMTVDRIGSVASTGVDFVSSGQLTGSLRSFDFSLKDK